MTPTTVSGYQRALDAEPNLHPIIRTVDALCALVRGTDLLCAGCVWESIVKPLVLPWLGWGRGKLPKQATDDLPGTIHMIGEVCGDGPSGNVKVTSWTEFFAEEATREIPATTATETWLRTSEAYDAFTDELLRRLQAADPANGHGIGRRTR